jgi:hypothetical protein
MNDRPLTEFQHDAQRQIEALVARRNHQLALVRDGRNETFLTGTIEPGGIVVWIYEDELEFKRGETRSLLERPDFPRPEQMIECFMRELDAALRSR